MKILFLTNLPSPYRVNFFSELGKKCDLTVAYERKSSSDRDDKWISHSEKTYKEVYLSGKKIGADNSFCPGIIRFLKKSRFDHIVIGMYSTYTAMLAIFHMSLYKIPFWISTDGGFVREESGIKYKLKKSLVSAASYWLTTGRAATDYMVYYGAKAEKCFVYPFTSIMEKDVLPEPLTSNEKKENKEILGISERRVILSVGQFIHRKGYDVLLNVCKGLPKEYGIYIVGGKPTEEYLEMQSIWNLSNVHFVGFIQKEELAKYYKAADLFVHPTREDIWGLVVNETLAYGLPAITTDRCIAGLEMIRNRENGLIVPVEDSEQLKAAIEELVDNTDEMEVNALNTARNYTIEKMVTKHLELFEKMEKNHE